MRSATRRNSLAALGFLAPTLLGFTAFVLGPMLGAVVLSLFKWNLLSSPTFVGLDNYFSLLRDGRLVVVYLVTTKMAVALVVINLTLGLLLAVLLEGRMPGFLRSFFRLSYFFPFIVSASAVALIWRYLMNQDFGLVNYFLSLVHIDGVNWLGASAWTPVSVVLVATWKSLGFNVLVFIAGLQGIPPELREAAAIDGAGRSATFWRITLPLLTPTVFFLVVINTIIAFQLFAEPFVLTLGGPGDSSRTIVQYIFEKAFQSFDLGYASAIALSLFVVLSSLIALQFALSKKWTFYQ
jgi:multiple sugar transport system permease protein